MIDSLIYGLGALTILGLTLLVLVYGIAIALGIIVGMAESIIRLINRRKKETK